MTFIIIYITYPNKETAEKIARELLNKKLVACANIFPISSMYWWKGKIENNDEFVSIVKTKTENWRKIKERITELHPYEVPCIMKIDTEANDEYEGWIKDETDA